MHLSILSFHYVFHQNTITNGMHKWIIGYVNYRLASVAILVAVICH